MTHPRSAVRKYVGLMLTEKLDVGGRVFINRTSPPDENEIPCALVSTDEETARAIGGTEYVARVRQRGLLVNIDILVTEEIRPGTGQHKNEAADDYLDRLGWEVEQAFDDDLFFEKLLNGFDVNKSVNTGLLLGQRLVSTTPYSTDSKGGTRLLGQRIQYELPYETETQGNKKYDDFLEYYAAIIRDGSTVDTVDRVLIAAEGETTDD